MLRQFEVIKWLWANICAQDVWQTFAINWPN
jgi:hypothetical protein